jgi:hypothetical protein
MCEFGVMSFVHQQFIFTSLRKKVKLFAKVSKLIKNNKYIMIIFLVLIAEHVNK